MRIKTLLVNADEDKAVVHRRFGSNPRLPVLRGEHHLLPPLSPRHKRHTKCQQGDNCRRCHDGEPVSADGSLKLVNYARRTGDDRLVVQVPQDVLRQAIGCFVTPRPLFLQCLHYDPIQVTAKKLGKFGRLGLALLRYNGQFLLGERRQPGGRTWWFLLAYNA